MGLSDLVYFDCNAVVGQRKMKPRAARWTTEHLLEDMDLAEIAGALIVHGLALDYDVLYANARLAAEVQKSPDRLCGLWCIGPIGEPGFHATADEMLRAMEAEDVRAVRILPTGLSLHPDFMGGTLEVLQHHRIPTLLEAGWGGADPFSTFHDLLSRYAKLPVVLLNASWGQQRHIHRLMALHDNLHLEFSSYQSNRAVERYVAEFGDERLLFGSGMTDKSPGAARAYIDYAQISEESRRKIAGGNLKRLLGGQGPELAAPKRRENDPIVEDARAGRPLSVPVVDGHSHVLHEGGQSTGSRLMYDGDAAGILETGRWCGIDRIAMMSWSGPCCTDAQDGNDIVWRAMERFGERVIGVATIDPSHMSPEEMDAEIRLRYLEQGFVGMKPYPSMGLHYDDDAFSTWWEFGNEHHLYALMHASPNTGGTSSIARLAERFPEVSWLMAHSGRTLGYAEEVADCIREHPNVYAEITYTAVTNHVLEYLVDATDEDHVIFGTDSPMRDPRPQLGWVIWADLPVVTRKKILSGNFERILSRARGLAGSEEPCL